MLPMPDFVSQPEFDRIVTLLSTQADTNKCEVLGAITHFEQSLSLRLDTLNGQTRRHGERLATLEERSGQSRDPHARAGAFLGALIGTAAALFTWFK